MPANQARLRPRHDVPRRAKVTLLKAHRHAIEEPARFAEQLHRAVDPFGNLALEHDAWKGAAALRGDVFPNLY